MNHRYTTALILALSSFIALYVYYAKGFTDLKVSFFFFILALIPVSLLLLFVKRNVFIAWAKYVAWWFPLSLLLILSTSEYGNGGFFGGLFAISERRMMGLVLAAVFFVISLLIIAWKSFQLRGKS